METLLAIREDLGRITALQEGTYNALQSHVDDDKIVAERVAQLELHNAARRGERRVLSSFSGLVSGIIGALAGAWASIHFSK